MSGGAPITNRIFELLNTRALPLTRTEIATSMGVKREDIRKTLKRLLDTKYLVSEFDSNGIEYITTNPNKPKQSTAKGAKPAKEKPKAKVAPKPITEEDAMKAVAAENGINEEYLRGYNRGYYDAMQISQKEAFIEGKRSVARKIAAILNIDMSHLLR